MLSSSRKAAVFFFSRLIISAVLKKIGLYLGMENRFTVCLCCDADFQPLKMLVVCGWGAGSGCHSHGESLAAVPGLAWMLAWARASKVS